MTMRVVGRSGTGITVVDEHGVEDSTVRSSNPNVAAAKQRRMDAIFHDRRPGTSTPKPADTSEEPSGEPGLTAL